MLLFVEWFNMQQGFTLLELLVVLAIVAIAVAAVALALPPEGQRRAQQEQHRLEWVVAEANLAAQRHRVPIALKRLPQANGYELVGVPPSLAKEPWAQTHDCDCLLARMDTSNASEALLIEPSALLPHYKWRLDVGETSIAVEYPSRAP